MANVLIVVYLLIVVAMIGVILVQRSEGGALGIGGGNNAGFAKVRTKANILTRTTAILAALFFATAIGLTILNEVNNSTSSILDSTTGTDGGQPGSVLDALNQLNDNATTPEAPAAPVDADAPNLAVPNTATDAPAPTETAPTTTETAPATSEQPASGTQQPASN